ncbi:hypothetical protein [Enhygromyxa salina]|uniref:Uncharacterized protein n=1 Tax=Enhygromyxa salina TaxID=215803 RepID=A0A2S9YW72_9BACT|nr:hypothetical protein [Enhygromyxa salina]PRQ09361.1 hypothetical protein ENSA7_08880 [Enhygromyxa salina]
MPSYDDFDDGHREWVQTAFAVDAALDFFNDHCSTTGVKPTWDQVEAAARKVVDRDLDEAAKALAGQPDAPDVDEGVRATLRKVLITAFEDRCQAMYDWPELAEYPDG